jgi:membrane associated rhomboid family serine protease
MGGIPPVTLALLAANALVYLADPSGSGALFAWFALWPPGSGVTGAPGFELWQLVTYSFLHGNAPHIFFNMLALYMFGADIERLFGSRFFAAYYFAAVVAAAICHLLVSALLGSPPYPTVGASGGIYGVLLAYGIYFPNRQLMLLIPPIPMRARTFVIVFAVIELVLGVTGTAAGIAHFAHLGGMLGGWLMIEYRRRREPRRRF